jgi:hypothetical protein
MSVHPIPGASYHTLDTAPLFLFSDVDLEAEPSHPPSKEHSPPTKSLRRPCAPPVLLVLLLLCCLAFVVSAVTKVSADRSLLLDVPESQTWLAKQLTFTFQLQPYKSLIEENYKGALEILYASIPSPPVYCSSVF